MRTLMRLGDEVRLTRAAGERLAAAIFDVIGQR
jgi:hypothetical protein